MQEKLTIIIFFFLVALGTSFPRALEIMEVGEKIIIIIFIIISTFITRKLIQNRKCADLTNIFRIPLY